MAAAPDDRTTRWYFLSFIALFGVITIPLATMGIVSEWRNGGETVATSKSTEAAIELSEYKITGTLTVPPGEVTMNITNKGSLPHNLVLQGGPKTADIQPGGATDLSLGKLAAGTYSVFCTIAGHQELGMKATLNVSSSAAETATTDHHSGTSIDYAKLDQAMADSIKKFPAKTEGVGAQTMAPTVLNDGTKSYDLTAKIGKWEVEPGKIVDAWTYNGVVPGPTIHVNNGDKVRLVVHNELPMGTDVHVHGVDLPNSMDGVAPITQPLIQPGSTFTYEFTAKGPAVAMYHAHHHAQMQVPNGMFAAFLVGQVPLPVGRTVSGLTVPADLKVTQEIPMVLNDAGVIGLSLNGKSFPATQPYVVKAGEWFLVHYFNEGMQIHPMHLHQFPQIVVAKDGFQLDHPYAADTVNVAPGERFTVLVKADKPGTWVWHCHILNHVEKEDGMFGMVTAIVVQ